MGTNKKRNEPQRFFCYLRKSKTIRDTKLRYKEDGRSQDNQRLFSPKCFKLQRTTRKSRTAEDRCHLMDIPNVWLASSQSLEQSWEVTERNLILMAEEFVSEPGQMVGSGYLLWLLVGHITAPCVTTWFHPMLCLVSVLLSGWNLHHCSIASRTD